jgi:hypothetical protein
MKYILRKIETVTDVNFYEVELTEEQAKLYLENEDEFWNIYADTVEENFEHVGDNVGDPKDEYELKEES